ncbi:MAG: MFS transporter [Bacillota bacterium]|nr:MFS transporter [Bacillota bacterium]
MSRNKGLFAVYVAMYFVVTMQGFVFTGIIDQVAIELELSEAAVGMFSSFYACGAAVGVPLAMLVFNRFERSRTMKSMLLLSIISTALFALTGSYPLMLALRFLIGLTTNSYNVLATAMAVALYPPEQQGRAMAFYISGASMSLVAGTPLVRLLLPHVHWRMIFFALAVLMLLALLYFLKAVGPVTPSEKDRTRKASSLHYFRRPAVPVTLLFTFLMFVGCGSFQTYITPYMLHLFPQLEPTMSLFLFVWGLASFLGNLSGGWVADRIGYGRAMLLGALLQTASITGVILSSRTAWLSALSAIFWLFWIWFTGLQVNTGIMQATGNSSDLIFSLKGSMLQLGSAVGATIAASSMTRSGVRSITRITLVTSLAIVLLQALYLFFSGQLKPGATGR